MIPKIIHYCWFGDKHKPKKILKCIQTWKDNLPGYEFKEWNQNNFDINQSKYVKEAYRLGKYAFVSDVARLSALLEYGGIYLDTDVIVYKNFDFILNSKCVFGFEQENYIATSFMACESNNKLIQQFLNLYNESKFNIELTNVVRLTNLLIDKGLVCNGKRQTIDDIDIYEQEYFSPYDYINCVDNSTKNTICKHLFYVSWSNKSYKIKKVFKIIIAKIFGKNLLIKLRGSKNAK